MSALSAGADTSTRLAPAARCKAALSLAVKMPVHSSAMSTPSSFHGNLVGSRSAETLILPLPTLIESPSTVTVPGKRPCTESKRSRCALVSTGPRSLIPTISISLRPDSAIARSTLRPMRPNPLIPTRIAIQLLLKGSKIPCFAARWPVPALFHALKPLTLQCIIIPNVPVTLLRIRALRRSLDHRGGRDPEVRVKVPGRCAGAKTVHADESPLRPDHRVPAEPDGGFDRDLDRGISDDRFAAVCRLLQQQIQRGHRDHAGRNAAPGQFFLGGDSDFDLGARGVDRDFGLALGGDQFIGAVAAQILGARGGAHWGEVLARQRQHGRTGELLQRQLPALGGLDRVG